MMEEGGDAWGTGEGEGRVEGEEQEEATTHEERRKKGGGEVVNTLERG